MTKKTPTELRKSHWTKCLLQGGNIRATAISAGELVDEARVRHQLSAPGDAVVLGEGLIAGLLLASTCKSGERVSLSLKPTPTSASPIRQLVVDADPDGSVRGFIVKQSSEGASATSPQGLGGRWLDGVLSVVRLKEFEKEPYTGSVPAVTGHVSKDLTFYLSQSEQTPSAVGISVTHDGERVDFAGGFLVQVLGGASTEEIELVESNIQKMESLAAQLKGGASPTQLLAQIFQNFAFSILEERELRFHCNCSRDRVVRALRLVGREELSTLVHPDGSASVHCDFCARPYEFTAQDIDELFR